MIKFINLKDAQGSAIFGQPLSDDIMCVNLPADTVVSLPIAQDPDFCMISSTGHVVVSPVNNIALPTLSSFARTTGMLNQSIINLRNLYNQNPFIEPTTLYFIAPAQCLVYVAFYSIS